MSTCVERHQQCDVVGYYFWGNTREMTQHKQELSLKHVALLQEENEKLKDVIVSKVSKLILLGVIIGDGDPMETVSVMSLERDTIVNANEKKLFL